MREVSAHIAACATIENSRDNEACTTASNEQVDRVVRVQLCCAALRCVALHYRLRWCDAVRRGAAQHASCTVTAEVDVDGVPGSVYVYSQRSRIRRTIIDIFSRHERDISRATVFFLFFILHLSFSPIPRTVYTVIAIVRHVTLSS